MKPADDHYPDWVRQMSRRWLHHVNRAGLIDGCAVNVAATQRSDLRIRLPLVALTTFAAETFFNGCAVNFAATQRSDLRIRLPLVALTTFAAET